ncbi:MAG: aldehyde-activating protein [SAR324 cluster bacterium]|uniref:Aldehyde-activating protein n=1 Tax=SAR324 cluster bacterium TaxID=2024889 RepID=A0A2A4T2S6_9DELT|nr:MAG: aldehyde-activating protein [SAR324 cluster bacterium]
MSGSNSKVATCLCGGVKITVATVNPKFTVCHCETCRTWGGGPFFAVQCGTDVKIDNSEKIKEYDSSPWASRGFCSDCGTHLFYRLKKSGSFNMPVGLFPQLENLVMNMQYFSDKRPDYYCFSNKTQEMTEAEIKAYFASQV